MARRAPEAKTEQSYAKSDRKVTRKASEAKVGQNQTKSERKVTRRASEGKMDESQPKNEGHRGQNGPESNNVKYMCKRVLRTSATVHGRCSCL